MDDNMNHWVWTGRHDTQPTDGDPESSEQLLTDGGHEQEEDETESAGDSKNKTDAEEDEVSSDGRSNVEVTEAGEAEPADPKWEKPDIENVEDIPKVEGPKTRPADSDQTDGSTGEESIGMASEQAAADADISGGQEQDSNSTAGMPNTARSPSQSRLKKGGADGYVVALELCARLPEDMRLPEEAADLVPVALEAELEGNVQEFASDQFDNPSPHVETLDFVDVNDELWLQLRLGIPPEAFTDLNPEEIQEHALQKLDSML
jgi:hypothetical protein